MREARDNYWMSATGRRWPRREVVASGGLAAAALGTAAFLGCGDDDKGTTGGGATPGTGGTAAPGASPTAVDLTKLSEKDFLNAIPELPAKTWSDKDIKTGGKSIRIYNQNPTLDIMATTLAAPTAEVILPVYNRLIRMKNTQDLKSAYITELESDLATKWERPDPETLVFTLAPNIRFHDVPPTNGRAFTADDVKYMFQRGKTLPTSAWKSAWTLFGAVDDIGNNQVRVKIAAPHPAVDLLIAAAFMVAMPREIGDSPDVARVSAVGTGPMILTKSTPNVSYEYQKNPNYFKTDAMGRKLPYVDSHVMQIVADAQVRETLFERGDAQWIYYPAATYGIDNAYDVYKRNPTLEIMKQNTIWSGSGIAGHYNKPPFSDLRVRQALNMLMDRKTLSDSYQKGFGFPIPYFPYPFVLDKAPRLDDMPKSWQFDPKSAKELLSAAGYTNGLELQLDWYSFGPTIEDTVTLYKDSAAQAGVKINLVKAADGTVNAQQRTSKSWKDLILWARGMNYPDPMATISAFSVGAVDNYCDVNDDVFNQLFEKQKTASGNDRKAILKQIYDRMVDQIYDVPYPSGAGVQFIGPKLKNYVQTSWNAFAGHGMGSIDRVWLA